MEAPLGSDRPLRRPRLAALAALLLSIPLGASAAAPPPPAAAAKKAEGDRRRDAGDVDGARRAYEEAVALHPRYAEALNEGGSLAFAAGDLPTALARFREAIAADPQLALAHYNLGYASRQAGAFKEAAGAYRTYVSLQPGDPDGYWGLAESCRGQGDKPCAIAAYDAYVARELRPTEKEYVERAKKHAAELRAAQAEAGPGPIRAPAAGDPALAVRKMKEGDAHAAGGRQREALFAYQDAVAADPGSPDALYRLGLGYARSGHVAEAAERWRATIVSPRASEPLRALARQNLERAQAQLGISTPIPTGPPAAVAAAPVAAVAPAASAPAPDARAHYERGNALYGARSYAEAITAYSSALAIRPDHAWALVGRANARIAVGQLAEARTDLEAAMRLAPTAASPLYGMALILERQGDRAGAAAYYRRYAASTAADASAPLREAAGKKAAALSP